MAAGFFDKTFREGKFVRCTAIVMIAINWLLFVIGFSTVVYGLRLGAQEYAQFEFLKGELDGNETLADDIYHSVKQSSGLTQGMTLMGCFAVAVATVGMCGSIRSNSKCLYCYAVSSMLLMVAQSIIIALLNFSVEDLEATVKTVMSESNAAKDLVRQNGQQALYVGLFAFTIEVSGFFISLLARGALNRSPFEHNESEKADEEGSQDGPAGWLQRATSVRMGDDSRDPLY